MITFIFGLLHGLGFAGALSEIGLPEDTTVIALLQYRYQSRSTGHYRDRSVFYLFTSNSHYYPNANRHTACLWLGDSRHTGLSAQLDDRQLDLNHKAALIYCLNWNTPLKSIPTRVQSELVDKLSA